MGYTIILMPVRGRWFVTVLPPHVDGRHLSGKFATEGAALDYAARLSRLRGWPASYAARYLRQAGMAIAAIDMRWRRR